MKLEESRRPKVAKALDDMTVRDNGVCLFVKANTTRGQNWLDRSIGMHFGSGFIFERNSLIDLTRAMGDPGLMIHRN
jgi:hypothetical protein